MTRRTLSTAGALALFVAAPSAAQAHDVADIHATCTGATVVLKAFPVGAQVLVTADGPDGNELNATEAVIDGHAVISLPYDATGLPSVVITAEWDADGGGFEQRSVAVDCPAPTPAPAPVVSTPAPPAPTPVPIPDIPVTVPNVNVPATTPAVVKRRPVVQRERSSSRLPTKRCVPSAGRVRLEGPKVAPRAPESLNRYVVRGAHLKQARFYIDGELRKVDRSGPLSFTVRSDRLGRKGRPLYGRHTIRVVVTRESCGKTTRHVVSMRPFNLDAPGDVRIASFPYARG